MIRFGALPPKHELSEQGHRWHRYATPFCLGENLLYINSTSGERLGIADGDWVKAIGASAFCWAAAFLGFGIGYAPILLGHRREA